jgi:hypothetical protein
MQGGGEAQPLGGSHGAYVLFEPLAPRGSHLRGVPPVPLSQPGGAGSDLDRQLVQVPAEICRETWGLIHATTPRNQEWPCLAPGLGRRGGRTAAPGAASHRRGPTAGWMTGQASAMLLVIRGEGEPSVRLGPSSAGRATRVLPRGRRRGRARAGRRGAEGWRRPARRWRTRPPPTRTRWCIRGRRPGAAPPGPSRDP